MKINAHTISLDINDCFNVEQTNKIVSNCIETNRETLEHDEVNIVKVYFNDDMPMDVLERVMQNIQSIFNNSNVNSCIFIACHPKYIKDIVIDKVEVIHKHDD